MKSIPIGRAEIMREGEDVLILAFGRSVTEAVKAYLILLRQNISATVVNCRFTKPLDMDLISSLAEKIPRIITVEENVRQGGFGSAILEGLSDRGITGIHLERIGIEDTFVEQGPQDFLRDKYGVNYKAIVTAAVRLARHHDDYYPIKVAGTIY
jgi:1-deoxy-D-xylulose-5-phosphate synthase